MAIDVSQMLINLGESIDPIYRMVTGGAYLLGILFAFKALYQLKIYGELRTMMSSQTSLKEPLSYLLVAGIFIYLPTGFQMVMMSTFGYDNPLAYSSWPSEGGIDLSPTAVVVLRIVQLVGVIAFVRGWILMAKSSGQGGGGAFGKGLVHVLGGVAAMNIVGAAVIVSNTLGVSF